MKINNFMKIAKNKWPKMKIILRQFQHFKNLKTLQQPNKSLSTIKESLVAKP